jgi:hypothetical protein
MSYSAIISFKVIEANEVYHFFQEMKKEATNNLREIAKENYMYMPSQHSLWSRELKNASDMLKKEMDHQWIRNSVFNYRYFYLDNYNLLCVFGVPNTLTKMFDCTAHFQNSCDQNYEWEYWNGIELFENIANKWKNASIEEVAKFLERENDVEDMIVTEKEYPEYYHQEACYKEIWDLCENYLYNEEDVVYISFFGGMYEYDIKQKFRKYCREAKEEKEKEWMEIVNSRKENSVD